MYLLKDILTYAYRGSGKYILFICVALSLVSHLVGFAPGIGGIAGFLLSAYFCAIYIQLIQSSATGGKEVPEFPEISNLFEDVIVPMFQILAVAIVSYGPAFAVLIWGSHPEKLAIAGALVILGTIYFPMAMLAIVILGHMGALSPHIVLPAIFRAGWLYWVGVVIVCTLYFLQKTIADSLSGYFIIGPVIMAVVGTYTLMTNARTLGLVYRERQEQLGWL